ncbi:MAG: hypothetical protein V1793_25400 [Pseudomonadota bacterium]
MVWIEAIMAFAVTMMAFSTIVSMIVEILHRIFRLREEKLKMMLAQIHTKLIRPQLLSLKTNLSTSGDHFAENLTSPDFIPSKTGTWLPQPLLHWLLNADNKKNLPVLEFIEKLARTEDGKALLEQGKIKGEEYLKVFMDDLISQYEKFEEAAREYFTRRARFFSILVAIGLAFCININPFEIFSAYIHDAKLRADIINQGTLMGEQLKDQERKLADLAANRISVDEDSIMELKKVYETLNKSLDALQKDDVPYGWGTPCMDKVWKAWEKEWGVFSRTSLNWFLSVVLGGLLIGLGGPFWFDIFQKLSALVNPARMLQSPAGQQKEPTRVVLESEGRTGRESDPLTIFKRAAAVMAHAYNPKPHSSSDTGGNVPKGK